MSNAYKNTVITVTARQKIVKARAGEITLPKIAQMAFGSGGVDSAGAVIAPLENQTALTNELYRKDISKHTIAEDGLSCTYECTLDESELGGENISEAALCDADGDIIGIKTFTAKGKDSDSQMTFTLQDIF